MDEVSGATLERLAEVSTKPVLVDFWAPWCTNCKRLTPVLEELSAAPGGAWTIVALNVEEQPSVAARLKVLSLPTLIAFVDGIEAGRVSGAVTKSQVLELMHRTSPSPAGTAGVQSA